MTAQVRLRLLQIAWTTASLLVNISCVYSQDNVRVELHAPRFVQMGETATLRCEHNQPPNQIYKVEYFKYESKIFQYVRERNPPYTSYPIDGAKINMSLATPKSITLEDLQFDATGLYSCEIVLELPIMAKDSKHHELNVIQPQKHPPTIKLKKIRFLAREPLEATCKTAAAHPAPHITWFVNREKVDESLTKPQISQSRNHNSQQLYISLSNLYYPLDRIPLQPNDTLEVTCISTIPSHVDHHKHYFDVKNRTIHVSVVRSEPPPPHPTQLSVKQMTIEPGQLIIPTQASVCSKLQLSYWSMLVLLLRFWP